MLPLHTPRLILLRVLLTYALRLHIGLHPTVCRGYYGYVAWLPRLVPTFAPLDDHTPLPSPFVGSTPRTFNTTTCAPHVGAFPAGRTVAARCGSFTRTCGCTATYYI